MIVAIDGPAGSGKSTVAHAIAERCHLTYLDTGAMYRSVTAECLRQGIDPADAATVTQVARTITITFGTSPAGQTVTANGREVTSEIRTPEVDRNVSAVSAIPEVRTAMVELQRAYGETGDVVAEGRDIGTVVFLTADPSARALRRAVQREGGDAAKDASATADPAEVERILADLNRRDQLDSTRKTAPLKPAPDAHHIDSSSMSVDEVVAAICALDPRLQAALLGDRS